MVRQVALNTLETIREKLTFERDPHKYYAVEKTYHTGNEILNSEEFMQELLKSGEKV